MLQLLCDDASDSVLIEINEDACKWVCKPIMERYGRVVAALTLALGVNGPKPRLNTPSVCVSVNASK